MTLLHTVRVLAEHFPADADGPTMWVAKSVDVPGLIVEEESFEALQASLLELIPVLVHENGIPTVNGPLSIELSTKKELTVDMKAA